MTSGPELHRLRADHASAVLAFELDNRAYFARFIADRGDAFFEHFSEEHDALLKEQESGTSIFHVLVEERVVLGRFNLVNLEHGTATLGYRVAEGVTGRGVATAGVQALCQRAIDQYGLHTLTAAVSLENVASQRVLTKAGFVAMGPAEPGGRPGRFYRRELNSSM